MKFNKSIAGVYYTATNEDAFVYTLREDGRFAGTSGSTSFGENREVVALSGWQMTGKSGCLMSEVIGGKWIDITDGWNITGNKVTYSKRQAQELVDGIIKNNKQILCNNILCARYRERLTVEQRQTLYNLQTRLVERNKSLQDSELVKVSSVGVPSGYSELEDYLNSFMQSGGIGSVSIVSIVIIAAVIAAASTTAYLCYKRYYDESEQDVKYSNELTKALTSKLTNEEYQQLLQETRGIVTKASIRARLNGSSRMLLHAGVAILAVGLLMKFNKSKQNG